MKIVIPHIDVPPSIWNLYKRRRKNAGLCPSNSYTKWKRTNNHKFDELKPARFMTNVSVSIRFWGGKGIRGDFDIDNRIKALLDQLVRSGYIEDDNKNIVKKINISYEGDLKKAECEIYIREMHIAKVKCKQPSKYDYKEIYDFPIKEQEDAKTDNIGQPQHDHHDNTGLQQCNSQE